MRRRQFLTNAGLLLSGATALPETGHLKPFARPVEREGPGKPKSILVTSAGSRLAQYLGTALSKTHHVRLTERVHVKTDQEFVLCAFGHDAATNRLVRGIESVVHVAEPLPDEAEHEQLDYLTRCTYNLLQASVEAGTTRLVLLSTLELMTPYDERFKVNEFWRPRPSCHPYVLAKHLCEFTCREFAREGKISVVVLRLGKVVRAKEVEDKPFDPLWLEERDVVQAVSAALTAELSVPPSRPAQWSVFHIGSNSARSRFDISRATGALKYHPQFNW